MAVTIIVILVLLGMIGLSGMDKLESFLRGGGGIAVGILMIGALWFMASEKKKGKP